MKKQIHESTFYYFMLLALMLIAQPYAWASEKSCFSGVKYVTPADEQANRALYIIIDETVPLSDAMKKKIGMLLSDWGQPGDLVKIARFSASYRGLYPELVFSQKLDPVPDDSFMFNLHYRDKKKVAECMQAQQDKFKQEFPKALQAALKNIDPKIPKTELLGSLKLLSKQLVKPDMAKEKTVFLVSDGLENRDGLSFYSNKLVKNLNPRKEVLMLRRKGMMGYWKGANIYMYGLGLMPDKKRYSKPEHILKLKSFWERYFVESGAKVKEIGTPEL
ncbi:MAG: hypothetical protein R3240_00545 [Gammaproteobacteria bacterium]|nr:hypothetical protein [Gammaproteobacteria bacterium]